MSGNELRVWIGCLHCYNGGRLTGDWFPTAEAAGVTTEVLHARVRAPWSAMHEELWVMDLDGGWPSGTGEMDPLTAQEWGDAYAECPDHLRPALSAWVETGCYIAAGNGDVPVVGDFLEAFQGEYDDVDDFCQRWAEDTGMMDGWPEEAVTYFDWSRYASDVETEVTTADAPGGGIFVFHNP